MERTVMSWSAEELAEKINSGKINLDNAIQRNSCWDVDRESLLINSMIENYIIPHFFIAQNENNGWDLLDGKQRGLTITKFLNNEFKLSKSTPDLISKSGEILEIANKKFNDLPETLQNKIKGYRLEFDFLMEITDEQVADQFFRLNSGVAMSQYELTRARSITDEQRKQIFEAGKHEIFEMALTKKVLQNIRMRN